MNILPRSGSGSKRKSSTFRVFFTVILFVVVGLLFWKNYERSMDVILTSHMVTDETDTLSREQQDQLASFSRSMQDRFGFGVRIRVFEHFVAAPEPDSRVLFMGISPAYQEVAIVWPPVLKRALPQDFVQYLEEEHFEGYWQGEDWPRGLYQALHMLGEELLAIEQE
ncbi:TPM domain-containing protein [Desulfonatronospira sp.]|uniref:TPM domain-containing protein n=1 Tax=Desulfonatronospira sp. TaxID=1962951 RepID=UPI0025BC5D47|nr:TPM domain-containing protein [Desulfonatronospira sp.]